MKFFTELQNKIKSFDITVFKIMKNGILASLCLCLFASFLLLTYETIFPLPILFTISFCILKSSLMFLVAFIICGVGFDTMKKGTSNF